MSIKTTVVFEELLKSDELDKRIVIAQGGSRSGKTFNILIYWIYRLLQEDKKETGVFGINIHKAGVDSARVDDWSHGCQVFKRVKDFDEFMKIINKAKDIHGNHFTYTLIESNDI